jgi:hypothetical protein
VNKKQAISYGLAIANRREQGYDIDALLEIERLNRRSTRAWEKDNTRDWGEKESERLGKISDRAFEKAGEICKKHGWSIEAPGLWWLVNNKEGRDIALPIY